MVAWMLGDRSLQSADDLRAPLPKGYWGRATRSDYWDAAAFPKHTHRCCGKADGETNHVERWFDTLRARVSRLVRKTTPSPSTPRTTSTPFTFSAPPTT